MAAVSFGDAAAYLGHKSRSTLYRLKRDGWLADYLRPGGKGGAQLLELEPPGRPTLREYVRGVVRPQVSSPLWAPEPRESRRPDPALEHWGVMAADTEALTAAMRPAPMLAPSVDRSPPFWAEWGRIAGADEPPLTPDEADEHAGAMAAALLLHAPEERPELGWGCWLRETLGTIADCRHDVAAGARWDQARWDRANTLSLLPDVADCAAAEAELRGLLTAGRVPADLIAAAEQALGQASS